MGGNTHILLSLVQNKGDVWVCFHFLHRSSNKWTKQNFFGNKVCKIVHLCNCSCACKSCAYLFY